MNTDEKGIAPPRSARPNPRSDDSRPSKRRPKLGLFGPKPDQAGMLGAGELQRIVAAVIG
ncbi:hypothetical protein GCM10023232_19820 [Sphingosinicella ginsenosidimutans]|uniref:Uncharacterized protein n=1 Tax=Allosphingosinicella ginsenosidimutans TaxID=1176539 RepID=A0A5C6TS47_9SPHN|nr:hypothetical protein [Sphingosinicella ginsenosidimutans]TXC63010.1 hypothetical protein FRZ32_04610 [Sphingosinicella ginsenosidimutans]